MNNKLKLLYGFLILVVIFTTKIIHAQENKYNKNQFTYFDSSYEFFDGSTTMDIGAFNRNYKNRGWYHYILDLKGYAYQRKINDRSAIKLGAEFLLREYRGTDIGQIHRRQMWNFDLSYLHTIWFFKKVELQLRSGIHYRMGGESLVAIVTGTGGVLFMRKLSDIGIVVGFNASYSVLKHWVLSFQPTYARYIYRAYKPHPLISFDKGTSKNMLRLSFGLGYQFGSGRKSKE